MSYDDLPIRAHYDPPITGPHEVVGEPGITHHYVFAGPNARKRPETTTDQPISDADLAPLAASLNVVPRPLWQRIALRVLDWLLLPVGILAGALLAMAWGSLDDKARLVVGVLALLAAAGHWMIRRARRRKVRS